MAEKNEMDVKAEITISSESMAGTTVSLYVESVQEDQRALEKQLKELRSSLEEKKERLHKIITKRIDGELAAAKTGLVNGFAALTNLGMFKTPEFTLTYILNVCEGAKDFTVGVQIDIENATLRDRLTRQYTKAELELVSELVDIEASIDTAQDELVKVRARLSDSHLRQLRDKTVAGLTMSKLANFKDGDKLRKMLFEIVNFQKKQDGKILCLEGKK